MIRVVVGRREGRRIRLRSIYERAIRRRGMVGRESGVHRHVFRRRHGRSRIFLFLRTRHRDVYCAGELIGQVRGRGARWRRGNSGGRGIGIVGMDPHLSVLVSLFVARKQVTSDKAFSAPGVYTTHKSKGSHVCAQCISYPNISEYCGDIRLS
jgi:hypothetical protein